MSIGRTLGFTFSALMGLVSAQTLLAQLRAQYGPKRPSPELESLRRIERLLNARLGAVPARRTRRTQRAQSTARVRRRPQAESLEYGDLS